LKGRCHYRFNAALKQVVHITSTEMTAIHSSIKREMARLLKAFLLVFSTFGEIIFIKNTGPE